MKKKRIVTLAKIDRCLARGLSIEETARRLGSTAMQLEHLQQAGRGPYVDPERLAAGYSPLPVGHKLAAR